MVPPGYAATALFGDSTYNSKSGLRTRAEPFNSISSAHSRHSTNVYWITDNHTETHRVLTG